MQRYRNLVLLAGLFLFVLCLGISLFVFITSFFSDQRQAVKAAEAFYQYEQQADFGNSWELFHSSMKERFSKGDYIQDRSHVFLQHFGVDTFQYQFSEAEKLTNYQVTEDIIYEEVYRLMVTHIYDSKYGYLEIRQPVIMVPEKEKWKVLWEYDN